MSRRSAVSALPVYRLMLKTYSNPTCVVAGPNHRTAWLYVHTPTPIVLRLHPPVVEFLLGALSELTERPDDPATETAALYRSLRRNTAMSYPECVIAGRDRNDAWLHVHAASPAAVRLTAPVVEFLLDALAGLPAYPLALVGAPELPGLLRHSGPHS